MILHADPPSRSEPQVEEVEADGNQTEKLHLHPPCCVFKKLKLSFILSSNR